MYEQRLKANFEPSAPHAVRLAFVAELAQRHPRYFWYSIEHLPLAQRCTLIALQPDIWDDVLAAAQVAQASGIVQIISPKQYA